ncbi:MAG: DMT family transporter [Actinomycetota bacterium]
MTDPVPGSATSPPRRRPAAGRPVGLIAVIVAVLSFSLSTPIVKWAGETGVVLAFWRMWLSVALWWIVLTVFRQRRPGEVTYPSVEAWRLVLPSGLLFGLNISLLFTAVTRTSIAHAEFIGVLTPLLAVPAGSLLFGERPNWGALRFGVISLVGVALVLFFAPVGGAATLEGDLIMVGVLCVWTSYLLLTKRARARGVDTMTFMACMMPLGLLTAVPMTMLLAADEVLSMSGRGWFVAGVLAVLTGMVAHGCIAFAQQHLPLATITVMQTSQPALAVLFAFMILGEEVRPMQVLGMALVISGITLFTLRATR